MRLASRVRFVDDSLRKTFENLEEGSRDEKQLFGWLQRAFSDIEESAFCGIQIPKKQIYSIENQEFSVVSIVLEWDTHKEYAKRLKYT